VDRGRAGACLGAKVDEAAEVDHALIDLAARGRAHELEVARWLLRAEAIAAHRRFGFASLAAYVERRLGLGPRELREKLRVARALASLPRTTEALRTGEQSWSAVRELTRVVTPQTEAEWLDHSRGRTVRQLERRIARHRPGDTPRTPRGEAHVPRRLVFELPPEDLSKVRAALDVVWRGLGACAPEKTQGGLLVAMAEVVLGERDLEAPAYQTSVTVCAGCARTWQRAGGELVEVSDAVAACAACDGEVVGFAEVSTEDDALAEATHVGRAGSGAGGPEVASARGGEARGGEARGGEARGGEAHGGEAHGGEARGGEARAGDGQAAATHGGHERLGAEGCDSVGDAATTHVGHEAQALAYLRGLATRGGARPILKFVTRALGVPLRSVTPQLRRLVFARDGGRCVVPGCGHWRFIDVHHLIPRKRGGPNRLENLACLCTAHHRAIHDGVLALEGSATEGWVARYGGGYEERSPAETQAPRASPIRQNRPIGLARRDGPARVLAREPVRA
jgi:hypothetical protein